MTQGGKTHIRQEGFTITEVLIVLAVTGFLFFTAFIYINGRQNRTEFQVGIRQVQQQFQQVINEVASGYYPSTSGFTCTASSAAVTLNTTATQQGSNTGCIFVGKAMAVGDSRPGSIGVFSLAGARQLNGREVSTLLEAKPVAIAPTTANSAFPTSYVVDLNLPNNITFNSANVTRDNATSPTASFPSTGTGGWGIAVVSSLADFTSSTAAVESATQTLQLYYLHSPGWSSASNPLREADEINAETTGSMGDNWGYRLKQAQYCFSSGTTNQSGLITIGNGGGLNVSLDIKNGLSC